MFSAAIFTAASISVRCIGFPKMMSNGSCGKDFAGKNDYILFVKCGCYEECVSCRNQFTTVYAPTNTKHYAYLCHNGMLCSKLK